VTRTIEDLSAVIDRRWEQLGERPTGDSLTVIDLPDFRGGEACYLGIGADGARLLVPFERDKHRAFKEEKSTRGLQLRTRQLETDAGLRWYLDVICADDTLRWLFSRFVADVVLRITRNAGDDATGIVWRCYGAWKAMFAAPARRLGLKQLAGLFGELYVLERLLHRSSLAAERWRGPLREPHDFASPVLDVEVKTTLSSEDEVVRVHGLAQLAARPDSRLWLAHVRVEAPSAAGESVPAVVARIKELDSIGRVTSLLRSAGYHEEHRDSYLDLTFAVVDERWYEVGADFPRLTANQFIAGQAPPGVGDVTYTLNLSVVATPPMAETELEAGLDSVVA
jgi:hypothetical protein